MTFNPRSIQYQGMPLASTPVINLDGTMNIVWYRFFTSIFNRSGLNTPGFGINNNVSDALDASGELMQAVQFGARFEDTNVYSLQIFRQTNGIAFQPSPQITMLGTY